MDITFDYALIAGRKLFVGEKLESTHSGGLIRFIRADLDGLWFVDDGIETPEVLTDDIESLELCEASEISYLIGTGELKFVS